MKDLSEKEVLRIKQIIRELSERTNELKKGWRERYDYLFEVLPTATVITTYGNCGYSDECIEFEGEFYKYGIWRERYGFWSNWENGFNPTGWYGAILCRIAKKHIKTVYYADGTTIHFNDGVSL